MSLISHHLIGLHLPQSLKGITSNNFAIFFLKLGTPTVNVQHAFKILKACLAIVVMIEIPA